MLGRHLKIFGSSLLALIAAMAVGASAANAEWVLGGGTGTGTLEIKLEASGFGGEMLVTPEGEEVNCTAGTAKATLKTDSTMKKLTGSAVATFTGCTMLDFALCEVHSTGQSVGTIVAAGEGEAKMPAKPSTTVELELQSSAFTELKFDNALCPFNDFTGGLVEGSVKLVMTDAATSMATHSAALDNDALFYGGETADLHATGLPGTSITGSVKKVGGGNWSITLQNL